MRDMNNARLGSLAAVCVVFACLAPAVKAAVTPARSGAATKPAVAAHSTLPWIDDDYEKAIAEARARKVPIFVEAWAPW
jgi:hypothetical protein